MELSILSPSFDLRTRIVAICSFCRAYVTHSFADRRTVCDMFGHFSRSRTRFVDLFVALSRTRFTTCTYTAHLLLIHRYAYTRTATHGSHARIHLAVWQWTYRASVYLPLRTPHATRATSLHTHRFTLPFTALRWAGTATYDIIVYAHTALHCTASGGHARTRATALHRTLPHRTCGYTRWNRSHALRTSGGRRTRTRATLRCYTAHQRTHARNGARTAHHRVHTLPRDILRYGGRNTSGGGWTRQRVYTPRCAASARLHHRWIDNENSKYMK